MKTQQSISRKTFARFARQCVKSGKAVTFANRYLQALRRRKVLKEGIQLARDEAMYQNPLRRTDFAPPLSVAGCGSDVIVRAERMAMDGIPVAIDRDARGRHRGTPLDEVRDLLSAETDQQFSDLEVLELYRQSMLAHPSRLHLHPKRRYSRIPELMLRLDLDLHDLESILTKVARQEASKDRIFHAMVDSLSLRSALVPIDAESVVVGCDGRRVRVNGQDVATLAAEGRGLVTIAVRDLRGLAVRGRAVELECGLAGWKGSSGGVEKEFNYYEADHRPD